MDTSATSATTRFFDKKRQELQKNLPPSPSRSLDRPWWQDPDYTKPDNRVPTDEPQMADGVHDFSRADHLKSNRGNCPNCGSTSFVKPGASAAARCFDCGYIEGRQVNDLDTLNIMAPSSEARTLHVRQTADGGAHRYRARIGRSASDINRANAELEQSAQGKAYVDS
jgi:hypothetical protein